MANDDRQTRAGLWNRLRLGAQKPARSRMLRLPRLELFLERHGARLSSHPRPLSPRERALAEPVFRGSIDYERVQIVQSRLASAPTTLGDVIRCNGPMSDRTLIHELMHIWQYQTRGTRYISDSLCHQLASLLRHGHRRAAYRLTGDDLDRVSRIDQLTAEQQAVFVELWFGDRALPFTHAERGRKVPWRLRDHTRCKALMQQIQSARPLSPSAIHTEAVYGGAHSHIAGVQRRSGVPLVRLEDLWLEDPHRDPSPLP